MDYRNDRGLPGSHLTGRTVDMAPDRRRGAYRRRAPAESAKPRTTDNWSAMRPRPLNPTRDVAANGAGLDP